MKDFYYQKRINNLRSSVDHRIKQLQEMGETDLSALGLPDIEITPTGQLIQKTDTESISDQHEVPSLSFTTDNELTVHEGDDVSVKVEVTNNISQEVTLNYYTKDGLALANEDYIPVKGSLKFNNINRCREIIVKTCIDTVIEEADLENFFIILQEQPNIKIIGDKFIAINIKN